jgi:hypothetical protein
MIIPRVVVPPRLRRPPAAFFAAVVAVSAGLGSPVDGGAQVDVQPLSQEEPPEGVSGTLSADLTAQAGNTDFVQLGLRGRIFKVDGQITTMMVGNGGLGFLGGSRFASSGLFHYRKTYRTSTWIWPEWYVQANYDRAQLLKFRTIGGVGVRTPVSEGRWGEVGAGASIMLEDERLELPDTAAHPRKTTTMRASTLLSFRLVASRAVVTSTSYIQPRFDDFGDVRVLHDLSVATPVTDRLAMTVSVDMRYDSGPPDGLSGLDARLRTGLTFQY